jgi:DNA-binding CsgD family transcriptional regulator
LDFELRDATPSDVDTCLALLASRFLCPAESLGALGALWREIIAEGSGIAALALDPATKTVIQFGVSVFVTDERADEYHACRTPLIAQHLLSEWQRGKRPFLSATEIARANAGAGLNLVVPWYGGVVAGGEPDERVYAADYESSRRVFRGWNLRSHTVEVFPHNRRREGDAWGRTMEFRIGEYSPEQLAAAGIPPEQAPWVWMARQEDALTNPSYALTLLFSSYARPIFGFTPPEQHILTLALDGHTDESIARMAGTSSATVKKRLREVYAKVADASPAPPALAKPFLNGARGAETRRHLLNYLRDHPEELRPYDAGNASTPVSSP